MQKSDLQRIESKKREWERTERGFNRRVRKLWKIFKSELIEGKNNMIYGKRPKDKLERIWYECMWFFKIMIIFFALRGFFWG